LEEGQGPKTVCFSKNTLSDFLPSCRVEKLQQRGRELPFPAAEQPRDHTVGLQKRGPEAPEEGSGVTGLRLHIRWLQLQEQQHSYCSERHGKHRLIPVTNGRAVSDVDFGIFCVWCVF